MSELIVVGVDGSVEAAMALARAAQDAALRSATLRVVSVARMPEVWAVPLGMAPPMVPVLPGELPSAARERAQAAVDALFAATRSWPARSRWKWWGFPGTRPRN
jgi:nucleotide-binding universal stress UspA family protein